MRELDPSALELKGRQPPTRLQQLRRLPTFLKMDLPDAKAPPDIRSKPSVRPLFRFELEGAEELPLRCTAPAPANESRAEEGRVAELCGEVVEDAGEVFVRDRRDGGWGHRGWRSRATVRPSVCRAAYGELGSSREHNRPPETKFGKDVRREGEIYLEARKMLWIGESGGCQQEPMGSSYEAGDLQRTLGAYRHGMGERRREWTAGALALAEA